MVLPFPWTLIVLLYWQTYFYIHIKQNLIRNCYGIKKKTKKLAVSFNHTYRYIDDALSINNHNFHNIYLIYPDELEIQDITESNIFASYLDKLLNIDSNDRLTTTLNDKRDGSNLQSSTFFFYVIIHHFHLLMMCISPS
jgi:hypothetical protein